MNNCIKKVTGIILILTFIIIPTTKPLYILAGNPTTILDTSARIAGKNSSYYIELNSSWKQYISVERESLPSSSIEVEKLNFYYNPYDTSKSQVFLMNLFVYHKKDWYDSLGYKKVTENDEYVFALYSNHANPFTGGADRILFNTFIRQAKDIYVVKDFIVFPEKIAETSENVVSVNGKTIDKPSIQSNKATVMLPLREVCTELGYTVGWNAETSEISITKKGSFYTTVTFDQTLSKNYIISNEGGTTYISSTFFINTLKCTLEIDEKSNVTIKGSTL